MNKLLLLPFLATLAACGSDDANTTNSAPAVALEMLDLAPADLAATIQAPKGAVAASPFGTAEIQVGEGKAFGIEIMTDAKPLAGVLKYFETNDVQKLQKVHVNEGGVLIVETEAFRQTSIFMSSDVGPEGKKVRCQSARGANTYNRAQIDTMVAACKSFKYK